LIYLLLNVEQFFPAPFVNPVSRCSREPLQLQHELLSPLLNKSDPVKGFIAMLITVAASTLKIDIDRMIAKDRAVPDREIVAGLICLR
jgi:hypothetical protein